MQAAFRCAVRYLHKPFVTAIRNLGAASLPEGPFLRAVSTGDSIPHRFRLDQPFLSRQQQPSPRPWPWPRRLHSQHRCSAAMATQAWHGEATQEELMQKDECILVDEQDGITGHASKRASHRFTPCQPRGLLHRAFSVFLFDSQNRLLLQQRAAGKITFPGVWTNTCCSHPLYGQDPQEVDSPSDVASAAVPGAKRAAVRKLGHELGIDPAALPPSAFTFLTRLHYCARDTGTHGPEAEWGEHEVDYVLFARADVALRPNPEEVEATRYVTQAELQQMMAPESGLLWSPWFRIIADRWLGGWWADLDGALQGLPPHVDTATVHKIMD